MAQSDASISITVTPDQLTALVNCPGACREGNSERIAGQIRKLLTQQRVVYGIDATAIQRAAITIAATGRLPNPLVVARGDDEEREDDSAVLHFSNRLVTLIRPGQTDPDDTISFILAPIARSGKVLVSNVPASSSPTRHTVHDTIIASSQDKGRRIVAGDHVTLSEDGRLLRASTVGYPEASTVKRRGWEVTTIRIVPLITVSEDHLQATLCLRPAPQGADQPDLSLLQSLIAEAGIVYGLHRQALQQCLDQVADRAAPATAIIAEGMRPVDGRDAFLRFAVEVGPFPGKLLDNGSIDFRERRMFVGVDQGQLIATRIPPTPGTPGKNVFGREINQRPGRDIQIRVSDDAVYDRDSGEVRARQDGVLSMVSDNSVRVCACQMIGGDIDYNTGNIVSRAALEIAGSVRPGFHVNALGDILVLGSLEGGRLKSDSNVVVRGGVTGRNAEITARGDADLKFMEHGRIRAGGTMVLRNSAYHSLLSSNGDIRCSKDARTVGCQLVAGGSISGGHFGAAPDMASLLAAAVDQERMGRYLDLLAELASRQEAVSNFKLRFGSRSAPERLTRMVADLDRCQRSLAKLNLIPGTAVDQPEQGIDHALACEIIVYGTVYEGTRIRIGNYAMLLDANLSRVRFHLRPPEIGANGPIEPQIAVAALQS